METKEIDRKTFFAELYELDNPDTTTEDVSTILANLKTNRQSRKLPHSSKASNRRRTSVMSHQVQRLGRTVSAPLPLASGVAPICEPESPLFKRSAMPPYAKRILQNDNSKTSGAKSSSTKRKRKRSLSLELLPDAQQIFQGLRFYFIPNDDVTPARKLRIRKAQERGAIWVKEWTEGISHVIADKRLTYDDIIKFLKLSSMPPNIVVVNEVYPIDCAQYRRLLNPDQPLYHVPGQQQKLAPKESPVLESVSEQSLPLKPGKRAHVQPSQTPPRTESSEQGSAAQASVADTTTRPESRPPIQPALKPGNQLADALDQAIAETLAVKDLPLDDDEDGNYPASSMRSDDSSVNNSSEDETTKPTRKKGPSDKKLWQQKFSCMSKHTSTDQDNGSESNARTISILQQMSDYYSRTQDHWRTIAYRKAISALKRQTHKITSKEEALTIPGIGTRLADKIEEIVFTDRLRRLENTNVDASDKALQLFLQIYGVGLAQASQWIQQGHRTLEDLTSKATLTRNQKIGIDRFHDFAARIPRKEVERHAKIVRDAITKEDAAIEVIVGGSYRRGAQDSGDVDFIITKPACSLETLRVIVFETAIPKLFAANYLKCTLASASSHHKAAESGAGGSKWHGAAALPSSPLSTGNPRALWRRIDFLLVPHEERGAALIYFTGNDIFNRSIRLLARKKGLRLNQRGLWRDVLREGDGGGGAKATRGTLVEAGSERRIFEVLGVPWRPPSHRVC
ncbi:MAG: hypothetical protein Q9202_000641 [Teloschistes flavicans]